MILPDIKDKLGNSKWQTNNNNHTYVEFEETNHQTDYSKHETADPRIDRI